MTTKQSNAKSRGRGRSGKTGAVKETVSVHKTPDFKRAGGPDLRPFAHDLLFVPLGGCGEIGMNLNLYGYDGKWLMVDLGVTFIDQLGMEVAMPDPTFIVERRDDLVGLVVTHAHEDHIGAIAYLWPLLECPIYATPFTMRILKQKLKEAGLLSRVRLYEIPVSGRIDLDPFTVEFITLTHSILEPNALAITTPAGVVVHTGDWKIDPVPLLGAPSDEKRFKELGDAGVLALVCDSTNVFVEGRTGSEGTVRDRLIQLVKRCDGDGRILIACFASNLARLETCAHAASAVGRQAVLMGRSLTRMNEAARDVGYMADLPPFLEEDAARALDPASGLFICTGSQGEPRAALARLAAGTHPRLKLDAGDTVIFSSRIIPGNEKEIKELQELLIEQGITVISSYDIDDIHVSGHPSRDDLKEMYDWVRPHILIPVHGEAAHLREQAFYGEQLGIPHTVVPKNGHVIRLNQSGATLVGAVTAGRYAVDGSDVVPLFSPSMRDRSRLMATGAVFVTVFLDQEGFLKESPDITLVGVLEIEKVPDAVGHLQHAIETALVNGKTDTLKKKNVIEDTVANAVRRYLLARRGKKPVVSVHVVWE